MRDRILAKVERDDRVREMILDHLCQRPRIPLKNHELLVLHDECLSAIHPRLDTVRRTGLPKNELADLRIDLGDYILVNLSCGATGLNDVELRTARHSRGRIAP
jgi:hypothetical protein